MSETTKTRITFLLEHELREAARAVRRFYDLHFKDKDASQEAKDAALVDLVNMTVAALWNADDESCPMIITNASQLFGNTPRKITKAPRQLEQADKPDPVMEG